MSDLLDRRAAASASFDGLVACGGFSFGDVLGAGEGWAKSILFNEQLAMPSGPSSARGQSLLLAFATAARCCRCCAS
jgi:phosphoribosylformylglycinamidine synthase